MLIIILAEVEIRGACSYQETVQQTNCYSQMDEEVSFLALKCWTNYCYIKDHLCINKLMVAEFTNLPCLKSISN
jgi:hypothetical protein